MDLNAFLAALLNDTVALVSSFGSVALLVLSLTAFHKKTMPRWITVAVAIACFMLAVTKVWTAEHRLRVASEAKLAQLTVPNFKCEIGAVAVAPAGANKQDSILTFTATIENTGAPSIMHVVEAYVTLIGGRTVRLDYIPPPSGALHLGATEGANVQIDGSDYLGLKGMVQPIPTNGALYGFMYGLLHGVTQDEIRKPGTILTFVISDINGKKYPVQRTGHGTIVIPDLDKLQNFQR